MIGQSILISIQENAALVHRSIQCANRIVKAVQAAHLTVVLPTEVGESNVAVMKNGLPIYAVRLQAQENKANIGTGNQPTPLLKGATLSI